ncbi:MAG TPA: DNA polymerase IV [Candidatus Polarisedimenticolaceae bacterium]|nr:DNA polymerase IV [Candidatus Polarisedimenticolaceae bacterium]
MTAPPPRVVLHLDMDAFYAAIEVREDPSLAGTSVIVGHPGKRGVVTTCSYEARVFGVRSAMPSVVAARLCPDAIWLPVRMSLYVEVSRRIRAILDEEAPVVEPLSIDEAFLDVTGWAKDLDAGVAIARKLKERIRAQERLTASVGVAPNKFLAKLASDLEKPDGLVVLPKETIPKRLWPLPVERLWGVGPKGADRLRLGGLRTIGDIARTPEDAIASLVGATMARHVKALAEGEDDRAVEHDRASRSISEERTYTEDLRDPQEIDRALLARAQGVARELRRDGLVARTVHLKVRTGDFTTWTRARTLPEPTDLAEPIVAAAREMFASKIQLDGKGVRLLGVGVSGIAKAGTKAGSLFPDAGTLRAKRIAGAEDAVRSKLGDRAVTRASLVKKN